MLHISNLRIEEHGDWSRLIADFSSDSVRSDKENSMWVSVKKENSSMLTTDVYNMFLLLPVYLGMYYHEDLYIHGYVSKKLFRNINDYVQPILMGFSNSLTKINIKVEGFKEVKSKSSIIGTGLSCGVDNLATIFKYYANEEDDDYKINGLFMLNCGWHGSFYNKKTFEVFEKRCISNKKAADDLNIPFFMVDSNLHAFLPQLGDQISYFYIYTCIFAFEKVIKKYYLSSSYSYYEVLKYGTLARKKDFSEFADPYVLPLLCSENLSIISDGCQYSRSKKTELIANWDISKKYLNVCCINDDENNCSTCHKCVRTLLSIEAIGILDDYSNIFDIEKYKKIESKEKKKLIVYRNKQGFSADNYDFCKQHNLKLPSIFISEIALFPERVIRYLKRRFKI